MTTSRPRGGKGTRRTPGAPPDDEFADAGEEAAFHTTYRPSRHEAGWLLSSLRPFTRAEPDHRRAGPGQGGKEASVYRCRAHAATGLEWIAAKVYRPRQFRSLRNDAVYREGPGDPDRRRPPGQEQRPRILRALGKKTDFGVQVAHTSWLMHEFTTMERLHAAGGAVPKPVAAGENAVLMGYLGDENRAAPTLSEVSLEPDEATPLLREVLRNIELMLRHDMIPRRPFRLQHPVLGTARSR
jgi:RIO kinase 1